MNIIDKSPPSVPIKKIKKEIKVKKSQMDLRWEHILKQIDFDPKCEERKITSAEIKAARTTWNGTPYQFEPRNLCKQDTAESRPHIFKKHGICILSIKNGHYILTKKNIYVPLHKTPGTETIKIKKIHKSCLLDIGNSETSLLDNLRYDEVLESDKLIGEKIIYGPLLGGRHYCHFKATLENTEIEINGSQYETDACYESENGVCIIEIKSIDVRSFNIRQLYYPYREVYDKATASGKKIMCLFIYKDKQKMIHIHKFEWTDHLKMMAIKQVAYFRYQY